MVFGVVRFHPRPLIKQKEKTMKKQLKCLQKEIDSITLDDIINNNDPITIFAMFKTISKNVNDIRKGKKPYTKG